MKQIKENVFDIIGNIGFGIKISFLASKKYFILKSTVLLFTTFIPIITIWLWKEILNNITLIGKGSSSGSIYTYLGIYLVLQVVIYCLRIIDNYLNTRYDDALEFYIDDVIIDKTSRVDLAFFDSSSMADKLSVVRADFHIVKKMTWLVFNIVSEAVSIITTFILVSVYNIWIGLFTIILLIPYMRYNRSHIEQVLKREREQTCDERKIEYYKDVFFEVDTLFEIKLHNIGDYFIAKSQEIWTRLYKVIRDEEIKHNTLNALLLIVNMLSEIIILIISIIGVINSKIGIGDLQYNVSMVSRLREQASLLMTDVNEFLVDNKRLRELNEFMKMETETERCGKLIPSSNPKIEFCNVWFRYPNSEEFVLRDCSFVIEPNEKVGLIGLNGAGKSTIIKLILRFYDPEKGCIKLDGVDLKEYNIYEARKIFGVLFQDYVTYSLPLREIIALAEFDERDNDEKLKRACDISGVTHIIKDWEEGLDSILGRYYSEKGKDLSGGQWQLVGLARAYFKETEYMILDEPSAALDPISEDRIFEQLYRLSENKSSVTISHRLSNTTLADKILVIEDGRIIEQGSHFELLKYEGKYAHLFNLQASKYA